MSKEQAGMVLGLDIGTSKVAAVMAEVLPDGELRLAGVGTAPSEGLKRGTVVNIDATVQAIQQAVADAEDMAGRKAPAAYAGFTGAHVIGRNSAAMAIVRDKEVTPADVARALETAKSIEIPKDHKLLLVEPQEFAIDGQEVKEPIGMSGGRLEVKVHLVTGALAAAENLIKCIRRCGLEVEQIVLNPSASSLSVLTADEKELGVALVDIGAGTTDVAVFLGGAIRHTAVIPLAGDAITHDIAMALRTPSRSAEELKHDYGCAKVGLADPQEQFDVQGLGDQSVRRLNRALLASVIQPRAEEILSLVLQSIRASGYEDKLHSGLVLAGGTSFMSGMLELAEDVFGRHVRRGVPSYTGPLMEYVANPRSATVMGLVEEARLGYLRNLQAFRQAGSVQSLFARAKSWVISHL